MASEPNGPSGTYRGVLLDYGGVLTTNLFASFQDFCEREGLDREALARSFRSDPSCRELLIALETGRLGEEQFERSLAAILGVPAQGLIARMFAGSQPDPAMEGAVRAIRETGLRTGLLSNSWGLAHYDRALLSELFDAVVISGEVGIRKPAPEIYLLASERVGIPPRTCVFVDDLDFNLEPAAQLGMTPVHHVESEHTIAELERLLGLDLRPAVR